MYDKLFKDRQSEEELKAYIELEWKRKDGELIKVRVSGRTIGDPGGGDIHGYQLIVEDIDQQRALEEQLRNVAHTEDLPDCRIMRRSKMYLKLR